MSIIDKVKILRNSYYFPFIPILNKWITEIIVASVVTNDENDVEKKHRINESKKQWDQNLNNLKGF